MRNFLGNRGLRIVFILGALMSVYGLTAIDSYAQQQCCVCFGLVAYPKTGDCASVVCPSYGKTSVGEYTTRAGYQCGQECSNSGSVCYSDAQKLCYDTGATLYRGYSNECVQFHVDPDTGLNAFFLCKVDSAAAWQPCPDAGSPPTQGACCENTVGGPNWDNTTKKATGEYNCECRNFSYSN